MFGRIAYSSATHYKCNSESSVLINMNGVIFSGSYEWKVAVFISTFDSLIETKRYCEFNKVDNENRISVLTFSGCYTATSTSYISNFSNKLNPFFTLNTSWNLAVRR